MYLMSTLRFSPCPIWKSWGVTFDETMLQPTNMRPSLKYNGFGFWCSHVFVPWILSQPHNAALSCGTTLVLEWAISTFWSFCAPLSLRLRSAWITTSMAVLFLSASSMSGHSASGCFSFCSLKSHRILALLLSTLSVVSQWDLGTLMLGTDVLVYPRYLVGPFIVCCSVLRFTDSCSVLDCLCTLSAGVDSYGSGAYGLCCHNQNLCAVI